MKSTTDRAGTGLRRAEEIEGSPLVANQAQFADILGVDRTTVRAYQQAGMPHRRVGKDVELIVPLCIHWHTGFVVSRKHRREPINALRGPIEPLACGLARAPAFALTYGIDQFQRWAEMLGVKFKEPLAVRQAFYRGAVQAAGFGW